MPFKLTGPKRPTAGTAFTCSAAAKRCGKGDVALLVHKNLTCRLALLAFAATAGHVHAQGSVADEYQVKAAFLFNFAKFVEWPADTFKAPDDPITICVWGQDPFGSALDDVVRNKTVAGRPFVVHQVSSAHQAAKCQIVFVASSERKRTRSVLEDLKGHSVLTVGEVEDFIPNGGVINFKLKDARVRIEIDNGAAERTKLRISSKLLSLAEIAKK